MEEETAFSERLPGLDTLIFVRYGLRGGIKAMMGT